MKVIPDPIGPRQESACSYPRPPVAEPSQRRLKIVHRDVIIADTRKGIRMETSHPPTYYFPAADIAPSVLQPSRRRSFCEWKGEAIYFDVDVRDETLAMWPGAIPIRTRLSDPCAITWPFTRAFRRLLCRWRARDAATWKYLRWVDLFRYRRPLQGTTGH
jgi:uncharacterized protein (DUF427 family)